MSATIRPGGAEPCSEANLPFDFEAGAELFTPKHRPASAVVGRTAADGRRWVSSAYRNGMTYRRFATVAEAIGFAIENLPPEDLGATVLEADGERFDAGAIRSLYDSVRYPLPRHASRHRREVQNNCSSNTNKSGGEHN
jgi:hypothetical protein